MFSTNTAFRATNYIRRNKNSLIGTFDLHLPSGLTLVGATHHSTAGKFWIGLPSASYVSQGGEIKWRKCIDFADKDTAQRFMNAALRAATKERGND
jgi:hypothetical protein